MQTLGILELNSIAAGVEAGDAMLKAAYTKLVTARPVCPGKYIIMVSGDTAGVTASIEAGKAAAGQNLVDSIVIPSLDDQVFPALACAVVPEQKEAVGVVETFSLVAAVFAADAAVKAAGVDLIEIRLGTGLGGKSFVTMVGGTSEVKASVSAAKNCDEVQGMIVKTVVIPSLHPDMFKAIL